MASHMEHLQPKGVKRVKITEPTYKYENRSPELQHRGKNQSKNSRSIHKISKSTVFKSKGNADKREFTMQIERQMVQYMTNVGNQFEDNIGETEQKLEQNLTKLAEQLNSKCKILEEADATLRQGLKAEVLRVIESDNPKDTPESEDPENPDGESLIKIIAKFSTVVQASSDTLQDLWKEWDGIQQQLICLTIEIYGEDIFTVKKAEISTSFQKQIDKAIDQHAVMANKCESANNHFSNLGKELEELVDKNIKTVAAQLEDIKIGQRKKRQALLDACQDYVSVAGVEMLD